MQTLLEAKKVSFATVDIAKQKDLLAPMAEVSGTRVLPQLHKDGAFVGLIEVLEELEEVGRLAEALR